MRGMRGTGRECMQETHERKARGTSLSHLHEDGDKEVGDREVEHEARNVDEDRHLRPLAALHARLVYCHVLA